jgi:hypothetical protein
MTKRKKIRYRIKPPVLRRPRGSIIPLMKDPQRFEIAAWLALQVSIGPYRAARLVAMLVESNAPITIESIDGVLLNASTDHEIKTDVDSHFESLVQKSRLVMKRGTAEERQWLDGSTALIGSLVELFVQNSQTVWALAFDRLLDIPGWRDELARITKRLSGATRSNYPEFRG